MTSLITAVPQARLAVDAHGIDLDALLATAYGALDVVGTSTLIDVTDGEEIGRAHV